MAGAATLGITFTRPIGTGTTVDVLTGPTRYSTVTLAGDELLGTPLGWGGAETVIARRTPEGRWTLGPHAATPGTWGDFLLTAEAL